MSTPIASLLPRLSQLAEKYLANQSTAVYAEARGVFTSMKVYTSPTAVEASEILKMAHLFDVHEPQQSPLLSGVVHYCLQNPVPTQTSASEISSLLSRCSSINNVNMVTILIA
eukprot:PhM_4_TR13475/c0_g1_i1/m.46690